MKSFDLENRIDLLVGAACYEATRPRTHRDEFPVPDLNGAIYHAAAGGRRVPLLKVLLTNICENNCHYCGIRASHSGHRLTLQPEELARAFIQMQSRGLVTGLFLSSGLCGNSVRTQDRLLDTVSIVREKYGFTGYVHLKILPGATGDQIEQAGMIADRVSVNLEAPSAQHLSTIAPDKDFRHLVDVLGRVRDLSEQKGPSYAPAGPTTQFVAGAAGESDRELLASAGILYRRYGLRRVYYSGFHPITGTPLEGVPAMSDRREHRLYQGDALLRTYGFSETELPFDEDGVLPAGMDPKMVWALAHPEAFPVEVNTANREALLHVPGIGPISADRLLRLRRQVHFRDLKQLGKLGVVTGRCAGFVLLDGKRPMYQLPLDLPAA
ncbi:MAG: radical SAM protein [Anaerolineae bacterium]